MNDSSKIVWKENRCYSQQGVTYWSKTEKSKLAGKDTRMKSST